MKNILQRIFISLKGLLREVFKECNLWLKLLGWMGATIVPFYERFTGREHVYHTCRENNRTVKNDFMILYKFCELEEVEE